MKRMAIAAALFLTAAAGAAQAESALADAIQAGDRSDALAMIADGADANAVQADGSTPLLWAVYRVEPELVQALLDAGADPDAMNEFGASPLAQAVELSDARLVKMLLDAGANPDAANMDGQTALMLSANVGNFDIAKMLVEAGADVNARESFRDQTALMWAADNNQPEIAELLIAEGADVELRAKANDWARQVTSEPRAQYRPTGGLTPLLYAARGGCQRCAEAMLAAGADINRPNPDGVTPFMMALDNTHFELASYLMDQGAKIDTTDAWGRTALLIAVDMNSYQGQGGFGFAGGDGPSYEIHSKPGALMMIERLLEAGVDPNTQLTRLRPARGSAGRFLDDMYRGGATPLLRAALSYDNDAIRLLLDHGALIDLPNVMGVTPFMVAAGMGTAMRDSRGNYGAYGDGVEARAIETLELLLSEGADINARVTDTSSKSARIARPSSMTDRQGQTAIYGAIKWGWPRVVEWLIENGAEVDMADDFGRTPLDAAYGDGGGRTTDQWPEIAAMIEAAGGKRSNRAEDAT